MKNKRRNAIIDESIQNMIELHGVPQDFTMPRSIHDKLDRILRMEWSGDSKIAALTAGAFIMGYYYGIKMSGQGVPNV